MLEGLLDCSCFSVTSLVKAGFYFFKHFVSNIVSIMLVLFTSRLWQYFMIFVANFTVMNHSGHRKKRSKNMRGEPYNHGIQSEEI